MLLYDIRVSIITSIPKQIQIINYRTFLDIAHDTTVTSIISYSLLDWFFP